MRVKISDYDIIFISYDEPRCEENWADLLEKAPWAKRVHHVKGFDAAHKAAANESDTDRFVTVDGDNKLQEGFIDQAFDVDEEKHSRCVYSFAAIKHINGLVYGNNGVKVWPKEVVLTMKSHETAEKGSFALDFCWDVPYIQRREISSVGYANGSPFQAFRAGFREGVKMSLGHNGWTVPDPAKIEQFVYPINIKRLLIWASVGADVQNGLWSMYGTRLGFIMANFRSLDITKINNYDWFKQLWTEEVGPQFSGIQEACTYSKYQWNSTKLWEEMVDLGQEIKRKSNLCVADLTKDQSLFVKNIFERNKGEL